MDFFLKLFGITATDASRLSAWKLAFHGYNPAWVILGALVLIVLTFWLYKRSAQHVSFSRRFTLSLLRSAFLVLVLGLLLRPVLSITFEQSVRRTLLVLLDNSSSMSQIKDQRTETDDLKRAAIAENRLDPAKGLAQPLDPATASSNPPRLDLVKAALKNPRLDLYPRLARDYDIEAYAFPPEQAKGKTLTLIPAASYHTQTARAEDRHLFQAYPWFMPILLALCAVALVIAGFVLKLPYAHYAGLGALALAIVWALIVVLLGVGSDNAQQRAATQPAVPQKAPPPSINMQWVDALRADGKNSPVGDAVREVISQKRGQPLAGILLVTDGASNTGASPLSSAQLAAQDRCPLYVYGVGITSPKDIIVGPNIFAQDIAFAKDEVPVSVRIRSLGMAGQKANLVVRMVPKSPNAAPEEKTEKEITFGGDGEQVVTVSLTPKDPGAFDIVAQVAPRDDEVVKDNNQASQAIKVIDGKIKVLFVEQYPRWEFKYAMAALLRDRRIDLKCFLAEADPDIAQTKDSPFLAEFPRKKEDLFKYDLIILGDFDPHSLSSSQMEMLNDFVSKFGGAMVMLAGKRYAPAAYRKTPIEKMLPVELQSIDLGQPPLANRPIKLELTPAGRSTPMLRIADTELNSVSKWATLPPIYWDSRVARAKPAAEVLLVDPDPSKATRFGKMPVIAMQQFGLGQVMFIGTDNLWRFRKNVGDKYHAQIWGQLVQRLALPHLLGASKRTQLTSDQKEYTTGSPITIYARLYGENYEPITAPTVKATMWDPTGQERTQPIDLRAIPEQPGMYRGVVTAGGAATYRVAIDSDRAAEGDKAVSLEFKVSEPNLELLESAMNKPLLEQMASASGGGFFREEDLANLPGHIGSKLEKKRTTIEAEIAYSWAYLIVMLGVITSEWILRKASQLK